MGKKINTPGRPTKWSEEIRQRILMLAERGFTDKEMAFVIGVTDTSLNNWKIKYPSFFESLKDSKLIADQKVERALFEKATGYKYMTQKPVTVSDGKDSGSHVELVDYEESIPPSDTSMIFWLKNRQPEKWRDKTEVNNNVSGGLSLTLNKRVINSKQDITRKTITKHNENGSESSVQETILTNTEFDIDEVL